jgi:hypothetical protein
MFDSLLLRLLKPKKGISGMMVIALGTVIFLIVFIVVYLAVSGKLTNLGFDFSFLR